MSSSNEESSQQTQHCGDCGSEEYHIHFNVHGDVWAACADCGRPTGTVGVGQEKKREWERRQG